MADCIHYCYWYTVWDAKTDELVAAGTSEMCARKLGYATSESFTSEAGRVLKGKKVSGKYTFMRERISRSEVDSLPPIKRSVGRTLCTL